MDDGPETAKPRRTAMDNLFDFKTILSSPEVLHRIERISRRRFPDENDADECCLYILRGLEEDGYRRLSAFGNRSNFKTYLTTLINSLAVDFDRRRQGRRRIPGAVSRLGFPAEFIYRLICWKKYSFADAYEILSIQGHYTGDFDAFLKDFSPVGDAPCPETRRYVPVDDPDGPVPELPDPDPNPLEALLEKLDRERRIRASRVIREVVAALPDEDRVLIRLRFGADRPLSEAARVLGCSEKTVRRRLEKLLDGLRRRLSAEGIGEP